MLLISNYAIGGKYGSDEHLKILTVTHLGKQSNFLGQGVHFSIKLKDFLSLSIL